MHRTCDAMFHMSNSTVPFQMKNVEGNISFLEYASPTTITQPSELSFYSDNKTTVYVTKKQVEVVNYVTKCTGQFLKSLMQIPGNTSYLRLITINNFKIDVDQAVSMLESIYKYAVTNQKGRDGPLLCKKFYTGTFEAGVHYLELVQAALHRHKYTYFSDFNCDVVQLLTLHLEIYRKILSRHINITLSIGMTLADRICLQNQ
jgi:hypothetical protein